MSAMAASASTRRCEAVPSRRSTAQSIHADTSAGNRRTGPAHLIWGEHDQFFPVAWAKAMVDTFPDARLEIIENARLFSHEERPAEVARALLPALTGNDS